MWSYDRCDDVELRQASGRIQANMAQFRPAITFLLRSLWHSRREQVTCCHAPAMIGFSLRAKLAGTSHHSNTNMP
jgi:hypothetical protein